MKNRQILEEKLFRILKKYLKRSHDKNKCQLIFDNKEFEADKPCPADIDKDKN